jgi:hypothetical protein
MSPRCWHAFERRANLRPLRAAWHRIRSLLSLRKATGLPVALAGDFNVVQTDAYIYPIES